MPVETRQSQKRRIEGISGDVEKVETNTSRKKRRQAFAAADSSTPRKKKPPTKAATKINISRKNKRPPKRLSKGARNRRTWKSVGKRHGSRKIAHSTPVISENSTPEPWYTIPENIGKGSYYGKLNDSEDQIRVLVVNPGVDCDPISCKIIHTSLRKPVRYTAVSYLWGKCPVKRYINLNDSEFAIGRNAHDVLSQLRSPTAFKMFWIDAICINQSDYSERSAQVKKMRSIFSKAVEVAVWLGPTRNSSPLAFSLLRSLYRAIMLDPAWSHDYHALRVIRDTGLQDHFEALFLLFCREYWSRVWVVQEIDDAEEITVWCGNESISWKQMRQVTEFFNSHEIHLRDSFREPYSKRFGDKAAWLSTSGPKCVSDTANFVRYGEEAEVQELASLVRCHAHLNSTDPRDKIYALVGLTTSHECKSLNLDYKLTVHDVYTKFVQLVVSECATLDIICYHSSDTNPFKLPSWTPDWWSPISCSTRNIRIFHNQSQRRLSAAGESKPICSFFKDSGSFLTLKAKGFCLGEVKVSGMTYLGYSGIGSRQAAAAVFNEWFSLFLSTGDGGTAKYLRFYETLICGYSAGCSDTQLGAFLDWIRKIPSTSTDYHGRVFTKLWEQQQSRWPQSQITLFRNTVVSKVQLMALGRRFFISTANIFGMAPAEVEVGDKICILLGCSFPVILRYHKNYRWGLRHRKFDGYYTLVGEAYVDEFMQGKAMCGLEEGEYTLQDFNLR